jgi:hypothetical protein
VQSRQSKNLNFFIDTIYTKVSGHLSLKTLNTDVVRNMYLCPGSSGVEQWTENPRVGGSNPPPGTSLFYYFSRLKIHSINLLLAFVTLGYS